ncbi:MAG: sigma-54 dependent transcriptional regulator [candidate division WOR-3 bacterium]
MEILIVEDEEKLREGMKIALEKEGHRVYLAEKREEAYKILRDFDVDLIFLDYKLPGVNGLRILEEIKSYYPEIEIILMTAYGTIDMAVEALKKGAIDFIQKPFTPEELILRLNLFKQSLTFSKKKFEFGEIITQDREMLKVLEEAKKVSMTDATVLIRGESGTGKELLAHFIHKNSKRKDMPLVKVNCGILNENLLESEIFGHEKGAFTGAIKQKKGRIELAEGGTLFLDEVGDIPLPLQIKLLRVLQEGEFERVGGENTLKADVRWISATHRNLEEMVKEKSFREDLFYRINVIPLNLPPLRERKGDIMLLIQHYMEYYSREHKKEPVCFSKEAEEYLINYPWPGNIRELKNFVEWAIILYYGKKMEIEDLKQKLKGREDVGIETLKESTEKWEAKMIKEAILSCGGNISKAAKMLGTKPNTLFYKIKKYNIDVD